MTHQWRTEGPRLHDLDAATRDVALVEAPSPRLEAVTIALRLRRAVADGETAALVTPDRELGRRVTAALGRWGIEPDDSAGRPLGQSAPGRLLRHAAALFTHRVTAETLLVLLKHPLVASGVGPRRPPSADPEPRASAEEEGPALPDPRSARRVA